MSQTHKSPIYMKYFKLLLLFLFISVQNATATYVKYKYSDEEISKNEKGINLKLQFSGRTRQTLWSAVQMLTQKLCCQTIHDCPKVVPLHYESE